MRSLLHSHSRRPLRFCRLKTKAVTTPPQQRSEARKVTGSVLFIQCRKITLVLVASSIYQIFVSTKQWGRKSCSRSGRDRGKFGSEMINTPLQWRGRAPLMGEGGYQNASSARHGGKRRCSLDPFSSPLLFPPVPCSGPLVGESELSAILF